MQRPVIIGWMVVVILAIGGVQEGLAQTKSVSKVRIELTEYGFTPATVTLKAGMPAELELVNVGKESHMFTSPYLKSQDLEIEGSGIEVDAPKGVKYVKLEPGKTVEIKFKPKGKGTFGFSCDVRKDGKLHRDLGMKGKLIVK